MLRGAKEGGNRNETDWLSILIATLVFVSFLFHLIGLGTTRWAATGYEFKSQQIQRKEHIGLWRYCVDVVSVSSDVEVCDDFVNIVYSDWLKAVQSFMVFAFFSYLGSLGTAALPLIPEFADNRRIIFTTSALLFLTGFFQFVAIVVFACYFQTYFDDKEPLWTGKNVGHLEWSFILVCLCCTSCIAGGVTVLFKLQGNSHKAYRQVSRGQSYHPNLV